MEQKPHCGSCDLDKVLGMTSLPFLFFISSGGYGWVFPCEETGCLSVFVLVHCFWREQQGTALD
jgi:hypothetical protein